MVDKTGTRADANSPLIWRMTLEQLAEVLPGIIYTAKTTIKMKGGQNGNDQRYF